MDEEEKRAYRNACMHFFKFNADLLAPTYDELTPRARGEALNAVYMFALYGEEPGRLCKAAGAAFKAARPLLERSRASAAKNAQPTRPDTRPEPREASKVTPVEAEMARAVSVEVFRESDVCSERRVLGEHAESTQRVRGEYSTSTQRVLSECSTSTQGSTDTSTCMSTQTETAQLPDETFHAPPDVPPDVPRGVLNEGTRGLGDEGTRGRGDDALSAAPLAPTAYEVGRPAFHAHCPRCGKLAPAMFDPATARPYIPRCPSCGESSPITLPPGFEARRSGEVYTLERVTGLTDGPAPAEGKEHGEG